MANLKKASRFLKTLGILMLPMVLIPTGFSCSESTQENPSLARPSDETFHNYWFQGLAEISRFQLEQSRYGEIRKGDAVLIFVTEQFLTDRQVKSEQGRVPGAVPILKLNFIRKFDTGIYPYAIMSSMFTPVEVTKYPQTLKVTTSIQEWCGQTFTQLNLREDQYHVMVRSYYMDEGDQTYSLENTWLEDNLWTLIRIDPAALPTGDMELIPGAQFSRLARTEQKPQKAITSLDITPEESVYTLKYKTIPRTLKIRFKTGFPFEIMGWEETDSFTRDTDQTLLTTRAVRTHTLRIDYWNKRGVKDAEYRKKLGLP